MQRRLAARAHSTSPPLCPPWTLAVAKPQLYVLSLCAQQCISDVINMAGMCGKSLKTKQRSRYFSVFDRTTKQSSRYFSVFDATTKQRSRYFSVFDGTTKQRSRYFSVFDATTKQRSRYVSVFDATTKRNTSMKTVSFFDGTCSGQLASWLSSRFTIY